jgi:hypothetical protein
MVLLRGFIVSPEFFQRESMNYRNIIIKFTLIVVLMCIFCLPAWSGPMGGRGPYGGYCEGPRWGWYGARKPVTTMENARKHLEKYFEGRDVVIGTMAEQGMFFKADVNDRQGKLIDQVIIHKRSGRIRSIY